MIDAMSDADGPTGDGAPRSTHRGRTFGNITYAEQDAILGTGANAQRTGRHSAPAERGEEVPAPAAEPLADHWTSRPSRSTGARRRIG